MAPFLGEGLEGYEVQVNRGFTTLKQCNYTASAKNPLHNFRGTVEDRGRIKQMLFDGFARCLYDIQKFDSDTERRFAVIRAGCREVVPPRLRAQFQIFYRHGAEQPEVRSRFRGRSRRQNLHGGNQGAHRSRRCRSRAKANAATSGASMRPTTRTNGGKVWAYLMIPHDEINEARRLIDFERFVKK